MLVEFWTADLLAPFAIACSMSILYLCIQLANSKKWNCLFYFLMTGGMVGAAWLSRLHEGGYYNVLLTAYAALSILFGLATQSILESIHTIHAVKQKYYETSMYVILLLQFACLIYNPLLFSPTQNDLDAGRKLIERISQIEGDVFVPYHSYFPVLAGKRSYANAEAMYTIMSGDREDGRIKMINEILQVIREKRFSAIILDVHESRRLWSRGLVATEFNGYCRSPRPIFADESVFWPVTGVRVRPQVLLHVCSEGRLPY